MGKSSKKNRKQQRQPMVQKSPQLMRQEELLQREEQLAIDLQQFEDDKSYYGENYFERAKEERESLESLRQEILAHNKEIEQRNSDLVKRETGYSAQYILQQIVLERSKTLLTNTSLTINEIAYSLGYDYPNYFSRLFKKRVGVTPNEYRNIT